jgi:hypothetical protein
MRRARQILLGSRASFDLSPEFFVFLFHFPEIRFGFAGACFAFRTSRRRRRRRHSGGLGTHFDRWLRDGACEHWLPARLFFRDGFAFVANGNANEDTHKRANDPSDYRRPRIPPSSIVWR